MSAFNVYGDKPTLLTDGHGADIASQRADDLDLMAIDWVSSIEHPFAIDIACGAGGQAVRLAAVGANVLALDVADMHSRILDLAKENHVENRIIFLRMDMQHLSTLPPTTSFADLIVCQRAIHYLPFKAAVNVLRSMRQLLSPGGRLFISASGMQSELGDDYAGRCMPLHERSAQLSQAMRNKHGIYGNVCLYSEQDMAQLLGDAGFCVDKIFSSSFGNVKAIALHG